MDKYVKLGALGAAALEALVAGAGVAIFFALGLRGLAMWTGDEVDEVQPGGAAVAGRRNPAGLVLAVLSFAVVAVIVGAGLYVMFTTK
jgi:hypothetical protein